MADPPRYPDPGEGYDRESRAGIPRWVQVVGIIVAVLVLLVVVVMLIIGPSGHTPPPGVH